MRGSDAKFLDGLTTDDIGFDMVGKRVIRYEGFTDLCWEDAYERGKSVDDLEEEIISEWAQREGKQGLKLLESGWWTNDMFYAIYRAP